MTAEDRRLQIIRAAIGVFARHGFQGSTTRQIAEAAQVSEAIIFRHFTTKQDLYAAILDFKSHENGIEQWKEEMRALAESNDDEKLFRAIAARLLEAHRRDPLFHRLMVYAALEGGEYSILHSRRWLPFHNFLCEYVAKRQKAGALRDLDPKLLVFALIAMPSYFGLVTQVFGFNCVGASDEESAKAFSRILMNGVRNSIQ